MKAEFLKIAKCKDEKSFYKKYPTQESFFKAHPEAKSIKKAQQGADVNGIGIPDLLENLPQQMGPFQNFSAQSIPPLYSPNAQQFGQNSFQSPNAFAMPNYGQQFMQNTSGTASAINQTATQGGMASGAFGSGAPGAEGMAGAMPYMQAGMDFVQGLSMIKGQRNKVKEARQIAEFADVSAQAAKTRDVDARRQQQDYFGRKRNALMRPINGEELFPIYGVGTNVLAKDGAEIQNTYAPNTLYDDLGYEPLNDSEQVKQFQYGGYMFPTGMNSEQGNFSQYGDMATNLSNRFINQGGQPDAGSMIGGGIGAGIGTAFGGPIGGAIGKFAGSTIGGLIDTADKKIKKYNKQTDKNIGRITGQAFSQNLQQQNQSYMEDGGYVNPEYNPQVITMFGDHNAQDFADYANKFRAGGHLKEYTPPSERAMETYAMGGELKTHWGGEAETMSYNPYLPGQGETIMFRGQSHDESDKQGNTGIGITYGNSPVEVERGEPAVKLKDGGEENLTVYGNLMIPFGEGKGKKFKNYIAEISKGEARQNKLIEKTTNELDGFTPLTSFDKLKMSALEANMKGANMKLKSIADKKINAAHLQNAINDTAEEHGLVADDLARGKIKINKEAMQEYAEYGTTISKAESGITTDDGKKITKAERDKLIKSGEYKIDPSNPKRIYKVKSKSATSEEKKSASAMDTIPKQSKDVTTGLYGGVTPEQFEEYKKKNAWFPNWDTFDPNDPEDVNNYAKAYNAEAEKRGSKARILPDKQTPGKTTLVGKQVTSAFLDDVKKETPASIESDYLEVEDEDKTYQTTPYKRNVVMDAFNQVLPFIRPTDQEPLDPRQLYGEMYGLSNNQLEPVQAQFYNPQLDVPYDISLQDQRNEVTAQTRAAQRMAGYNPAAQAMIASQAYEPLNKITGEEFRLNQAMKDRVYSGNRATLNNAQLKNLEIADQQYQRQSQAKSNTKAIAQAALQSIGDKYAKNRLENRELGIYENMYNYRYDNQGRAINMNPLYQANIPTVYSKQTNPNMLPVYDADGNQTGWKPAAATPGIVADNSITPIEDSKGKYGKSIKGKNGSIVKSYKNL